VKLPRSNSRTIYLPAYPDSATSSSNPGYFTVLLPMTRPTRGHVERLPARKLSPLQHAFNLLDPQGPVQASSWKTLHVPFLAYGFVAVYGKSEQSVPTQNDVFWRTEWLEDWRKKGHKHEGDVDGAITSSFFRWPQYNTIHSRII
jgi:hypothetical protein